MSAPSTTSSRPSSTASPHRLRTHVRQRTRKAPGLVWPRRRRRRTGVDRHDARRRRDFPPPVRGRSARVREDDPQRTQEMDSLPDAEDSAPGRQPRALRRRRRPPRRRARRSARTRRPARPRSRPKSRRPTHAASRKRPRRRTRRSRTPRRPRRSSRARSARRARRPPSRGRGGRCAPQGRGGREAARADGGCAAAAVAVRRAGHLARPRLDHLARGRGVRAAAVGAPRSRPRAARWSARRSRSASPSPARSWPPGS